MWHFSGPPQQDGLLSSDDKCLDPEDKVIYVVFVICNSVVLARLFVLFFLIHLRWWCFDLCADFCFFLCGKGNIDCHVSLHVDFELY